VSGLLQAIAIRMGAVSERDRAFPFYHPVPGAFIRPQSHRVARSLIPFVHPVEEIAQIPEQHHTGRAWRYIAATHLDLDWGRSCYG
jgi:hypothetical protein